MMTNLLISGPIFFWANPLTICSQWHWTKSGHLPSWSILAKVVLISPQCILQKSMLKIWGQKIIIIVRFRDTEWEATDYTKCVSSPSLCSCSYFFPPSVSVILTSYSLSQLLLLFCVTRRSGSDVGQRVTGHSILIMRLYYFDSSGWWFTCFTWFA